MMTTPTIKTTDKIKLLDQMLEDIAGDEFEDFDTTESAVSTNNKHYGHIEELDIIDSMH